MAVEEREKVRRECLELIIYCNNSPGVYYKIWTKNQVSIFLQKIPEDLETN